MRGAGAKSRIVRPVLTPVDAQAPAALHAEIGAMPLAFGTAHNLLVRADVGAGTALLVACAGDAAGYAAIRLARTHGAEVTALCPAAAEASARAAGAVILSAPPRGAYDAVVDLSGVEGWRALLQHLRPGGIYATTGVIAGPAAPGEARAVHLNDLTLFGRPHLPREVFSGLVSTITLGMLKLVHPQTRSEIHD